MNMDRLPILPTLHPVRDVSLGRTGDAPSKSASRMGCILNRMQRYGVTASSTERYSLTGIREIKTEYIAAATKVALKNKVFPIPPSPLTINH